MHEASSSGHQPVFEKIKFAPLEVEDQHRGMSRTNSPGRHQTLLAGSPGRVSRHITASAGSSRRSSASSSAHLLTVDEQTYTIDEAMTSIGYGKFHWLLLCFSGLVWFSDAMEVMLLSFLGPAVQCQWGVSPEQESLLTSVVFGGMLLGSCFWGAVADMLGRRAAFLATATFTACFGLLSAAAPSYTVLLVMRAGVGCGLSGAVTQYTLFMEWLPPKLRGKWLVLFNLWWTAGTICEALLAWVVLNGHGWRVLLALSAIPLGVLLLLYPWVPDSPRYLLAQGNHQQALQLLKRAAAVNGTKLPAGRLLLPPAAGASPQPAQGNVEHNTGDSAPGHGLIANVMMGARTVATALGQLLQGRGAIVVLALLFVWFTNALAYYGLVMLATELNIQGDNAAGISEAASVQQEHCHGSAITLPTSSYVDTIFASSAELPALAFSVAVVDAARVGRHRVVALSLHATAAAVALLWVLPAPPSWGVTLSLFFSRWFIMAAYTILYIFTPELLPTQVRALGMGMCNSVSRVGGLVAPFIAVDLVRQGKVKAAVGVFVGLCVFAALAVEAVGALTGRGKGLMMTGGGPAAAAVSRDGAADGCCQGPTTAASCRAGCQRCGSRWSAEGTTAAGDADHC